MQDKIIIRGAREHNLKNFSVEIPKNKLVVFTGLSGSGKSSLAFDTIYAEGQRRYVESLSSYARQFLGVMDKPDVDTIEGLSPAISIDQKSVPHNPRSTVGTVTEIYDYLRLLFARIGHPHCPACGREISRQSAQQISENILEAYSRQSKNLSARILILSPIVRDRKGEFRELFTNLRTKGISRVRIDNHLYGLNEDIYLLKNNRHTIEAVIDRITLNNKQQTTNNKQLYSRVFQSVEQALRLSEGMVIVSSVNDPSFIFPEKPKNMTDHLYSEKFACPACNISLSEIEPRTFSFNSPHGACPGCDGIGSILKVDPELVLAPNITINEGGIIPFARMFEHDSWFSRIIRTVCRQENIPLDKPLKSLDLRQKQILFFGDKEKIYEIEGVNRQGRWTKIRDVFEGVINNLERRYRETDSDFMRLEIEKYMRKEICSSCTGGRLKRESLAVTTAGKTIVEVAEMSIKKSLKWFSNLDSLSAKEKTIAKPIFKEIINRLTFLVSVGLDYLTLNRAAMTMAGGEMQRIRLASQIGSGLSGVLYVLDEPSIGLHQRDNKQLIRTLHNLRDLGNTVIVVEHDAEMMENADYIFDFGPGAGDQGGEIIAHGTIEEIKNNPKSLTGKYLSGKKKIQLNNKFKTRNPDPEANSKSDFDIHASEFLVLKGCRANNLKNIDVKFPLGKFICVTGVSGSGKSTLAVDTLYHALSSEFNPFHRVRPGRHHQLINARLLDKIVLIDQSPIGRTPRSNPATYTGAFTFIRDLFSHLPEAKIRGYKPGRFSFNLKGGRCEACEGEGQIKIEMQFLPDIYVNCDLCAGKRYNSETLEVHFKEKNIAEVLDMPVAQALEFFRNIPGLYEKLLTLKNVGLSYIKLGQPAPTLSGGEAQRVKLSAELARRATGKTFYILDEPTTGLHFADLEKLLFVLRGLVDKGNTVVVIEHNLEVIKNAEWIIDLGPEGGEDGGEVVAAGTPLDLTKNSRSYTGAFLKKTFQNLVEL